MVTRNYSAAAMSCLAMALTRCDYGQSLVVRNAPFMLRRASSFSRVPRRNRSSSMKMYIDYDMMPITPIDIPSLPLAATSSNIFVATSKMITSDPQLEVELLNDVSHVALDVITFLSPNTAFLRLGNVIGRALLLTSDYIQDNHVTNDEWAFQVGMLAFSTHMFFQSAGPVMMAMFSISALTVRERRTYSLLFEAVGLTVLQFKTLLASRTLDWVEYEPNENVELNGEYMYFLYSGEAAIPVAGNKTGNNKGTSTETDVISEEEGLHISSRIFGDVQFAKTLESSLHKKSKKTSKSDKKSKSPTQDTDKSAVAPRSSLIVGSNGASMLRISTSKLLELMKNDDELSSSIQRLVLLCMQEKLSRSLEEGGSKSSSKKSPSAIQPSDSSSSTPNATHTILSNI